MLEPFQITKPGIFLDVPEADYFADPCPLPSLTQSVAKVLIDYSALHAHAEHPRLRNPDLPDEEETEKYDKAKAIGNAAHKALIGRGKEIAAGDFPNWTSKDAKAFKADALDAGRTPILMKHMATAHRMVTSAKLQILNAAGALNEDALNLAFRTGAGEVVVAAEIDGIWLRSLIDWMVDPRVLFDFKTTGMSVAPHNIDTLMANAGWPIQAATQERILDKLDPEGAGRRQFFFVAQENWEPFALTICKLPEATLWMGRKMLMHAEEMWRAGMLHGQWPGYPVEIVQPHYPPYVETKWLAREVAHADRKAVVRKIVRDGENLRAG